MEFAYAYKGNTTVGDSGKQTQMSFAPDLTREPTFFIGELGHSVAFREAISALHKVVISDLRYQPKDKTEYKQWRAEQDALEFQARLALIDDEIASQIASETVQTDQKIKNLPEQRQAIIQKIGLNEQELRELRGKYDSLNGDFYGARRKYFDYLYEKDKAAWWVLDPVITVHPDEVFFECFSQDESTYGRLGTSYEVFKKIDEFSCGTTNIDYSEALYNEFQKIRSYKTTKFEIDPSGFEVKTTQEEDFKEVKIDLPDSWVRGFLQVSSAMSLPGITFDLQPMDIHNICLVLRRHKAVKSPRGMRYILKPGQPIKILFEPWNIEVICHRSPYLGTEEQEVRVWGRRRLLVLERLIPIAQKFTVHLLGTGLPSFYIADLGNMSFTLGLSGWTANDWSQAGNFDLMAPRADVDSQTQMYIFESLSETWVEKPEDLAKRLNLSTASVWGALSAFTQAGRAIYDLNKKVYRRRELTREPLPMEKLRFANEREEKATRFLANQTVEITTVQDSGQGYKLAGNVQQNEKIYNPELTIDMDERIVKAECDCNWHLTNKLYKGPCEHILALRMQYARQRN
jgi:biotin operon repressor